MFTVKNIVIMQIYAARTIENEKAKTIHCDFTGKVWTKLSCW